MSQSQRATTDQSEHGDELPLVDEARLRAILQRIGFGKIDVIRADAILADLSADAQIATGMVPAPALRESLPPKAPSLPPTDVAARLSSRPPEGERTSSIPPLDFPESDRPASLPPPVIDLEAQTNASGEAVRELLSDSIAVDVEEPRLEEDSAGAEEARAEAAFRASMDPSLAKHISDQPDEGYQVDDETSVADEARAVFVDLSADRDSVPATGLPHVTDSQAPPSRPAIRPGSVERHTRELTMPEVTPGMLSDLTQPRATGDSAAPTFSDTDVPTARVSSQPPQLQFDDEETARADSIPPLPPPVIRSAVSNENASPSAAPASSGQARSIPIAHLGRTEPPPFLTDRSPPLVTDRSPPPSYAPSGAGPDWPSGDSFDQTPASDLRVEDLDPDASQPDRDDPVIEIGRLDATALDPDLLDATPHSGEDLDALLNTELPVEREAFRRRSELPEHASEEELAELLDEEIFPDEFEDLTNTPSAELFRSDPRVAVISVDAEDDLEARTDPPAPAGADPKSGITESIPPAPAVLAAAARADARGAGNGHDEEDTFFAGEDETEVVTSDHLLNSSFPPRAGIDTARKDLPEDPPTVTVRGNRRAAVQAAARAIAAGQTAEGLPEPEVTENPDEASPSAPPPADGPAQKPGFFKKIFGR